MRTQTIWTSTWENGQLTCVPRRDSRHPTHPYSLIRVSIDRMKKLCILGYPKYVQSRLWLDCANLQTYMNLRWAHMPDGTFSDVASHESQRTTKPTIRLVRSAKTQIRLRIRAVWSESSLIAWAFYSLQVIQRGIHENSCKTGWIYRLIWVFAGHTGFIEGFVVRWLICLCGEIR